MNVALILTILLLTIGATTVFYALVSNRTSEARTVIGAAGFLVLFVTLYTFAAATA